PSAPADSILCRPRCRLVRAGTCPGATAVGAASTHRRERQMLRRFQADRALLLRGNRGDIARIVVMFSETPFGEETTMRWKIGHHGHDPRQIDLLAAI